MLRTLLSSRAALLLATLMTTLLVGCGTIAPPAQPMAGAPMTTMAAEPEALPAAAPEPRPVPADAHRAQRRAATPSAAPADAVPRIERIAPGYPNAPYSIRGIGYEPVNEDVPMKEIGVASWYGADFHGKPSSTGERFNMKGMSAAHPTMPLPSYAIVRNLDNGRQVVVRVNDRGPFIGNRVIDLSQAAARKLGISGLGRVEVERITHTEIRTGAWKLSGIETASAARPAFAAAATAPLPNTKRARR